MKNKILVTGGKGFVGSRLVKRLIDLGNEVVVIDDMSYGNEDNMIVDNEDISNKFDFYNEDISNDISYIFDKHKFDYVFNFAGIAPLPDCQMNKNDCLRSNVQGTLNVLEQSRLSGVKRFFLSSSNSVYENSPYEMNEFKDLHTTLFYPTSKLMAEELCWSFSLTYNMPITVFRFANVYGEGMDIARKYPPVTGAFIKKLFYDERPVIYSDGMQQRDFIYIDDLIDFAILVMNESNELFEILNVGAGKCHSILEQFNLIKSFMGKDLQPMFVSGNDFWKKMPEIYNGYYKIKEKVLNDEVNKFTCMDMEYVESKYGWKAKYSFNDGMKKTVDKMCEYLMRLSHEDIDR